MPLGTLYYFAVQKSSEFNSYLFYFGQFRLDLKDSYSSDQTLVTLFTIA